MNSFRILYYIELLRLLHYVALIITHRIPQKANSFSADIIDIRPTYRLETLFETLSETLLSWYFGICYAT